MMKRMCLLLIIFTFQFSAKRVHAEDFGPAVGDRATYVNQDITSHHMTISQTVLEILAFDPILNQFSVQRSFYLDSLPPQVSTVDIAEQLLKKIYLSNPSTAEDCAQYFSRIDHVATSSKIVNIVAFYDMGKFTSCQYTEAKAAEVTTSIYGKVPFGLMDLHNQSQDGNESYITLRAFTKK